MCRKSVITRNIIKMKLPNKSVQLSTAGPHPLTMTPIHVAHKDSDNVAERTRSGTQQFKDIGQMICGSEALPTQTAHIIKSFDSESRAVIINNLGTIIKIPADEMTAMKTSLSLPWNLVREIRRWLRTFKVNVASERSMRDVSTEWVGTGLRTEEIPATVKKRVLRLC